MQAARRVHRREVRPLSAALARAFYDDPMTCWMLPDPGRRLAHTRRLFRARVRQLARQGETWTVDAVGGAVWAVPDAWKVGPLAQLRLLAAIGPALGRRLTLVATGLQQIELCHPRAPAHWYLAILGVDPPAQGRGLGSALLAPVLGECDRDGVPAYLETARERNLDFYARHGFRVTDELRLPEGPRVWLMWREPG